MSKSDLAFLAIALVIFISSVVVIVKITDKMWTRRCQSQYGQKAVNGYRNGECIIEDGTIRYLR